MALRVRNLRWTEIQRFAITRQRKGIKRPNWCQNAQKDRFPIYTLLRDFMAVILITKRIKSKKHVVSQFSCLLAEPCYIYCDFLKCYKPQGSITCFVGRY